MAEQTAEPAPAEKQLRRWRYDEARRLGLPRRAAQTFADEELSPAALRALILGGCDPLTAFDILR